jgi:hypothetical protein
MTVTAVDCRLPSAECVSARVTAVDCPLPTAECVSGSGVGCCLVKDYELKEFRRVNEHCRNATAVPVIGPIPSLRVHSSDPATGFTIDKECLSTSSCVYKLDSRSRHLDTARARDESAAPRLGDIGSVTKI